MRQNIGLSLAIVIVLIPLSLLGVLGLATVVAVHELAEIVVITNGVRAGRARLSSTVAHAPAPAPVTAP